MARSQWRPRQGAGSGALTVDAALLAEFENDLAFRWHRQSDHILTGVGLGEDGCTCVDVGRRLRALITDLLNEPSEERAGLGAVVANPLTGGVWVRASHPRLPSLAPEAPGQDWADPMSEAWFAWADLPRPLLLRADGWVPPIARSGGESTADQRPEGL